MVLNPERRAGVTIKTTICHHWSQPTQSATKSPGSAHGSFISASVLRKESLATPDFYRTFRKLYISCRSVTLSYPIPEERSLLGVLRKMSDGSQAFAVQGDVWSRHGDISEQQPNS